MSDSVKPLSKDLAFWFSVLRALLQAGAALVVGTVRYWDPKGQEPGRFWFAALVLAGLVIYEPLHERHKQKRAGITERERRLVSAALARLVAEVQLASRADVVSITAHVHSVKKRWPWTQPRDLDLERIERLVFDDSFGPTDIRFKSSKGVIGACLNHKARTSLLMSSRTVNASHEAVWDGLPADQRAGLSWAEQRQLANRRYGGLLAEPVKDDHGSVIAVVSLGIQKGFEGNLSTDRVGKALGTAASDLSKALQR